MSKEFKEPATKRSKISRDGTAQGTQGDARKTPTSKKRSVSASQVLDRKTVSLAGTFVCFFNTSLFLETLQSYFSSTDTASSLQVLWNLEILQETPLCRPFCFE